jgi:hypothetical protein
MILSERMTKSAVKITTLRLICFSHHSAHHCFEQPAVITIKLDWERSAACPSEKIVGSCVLLLPDTLINGDCHFGNILL